MRDTPKRYDLSDNSEKSFTAAQLRKADRETQKAVVKTWFFANYPGADYEEHLPAIDPSDEIEEEFNGIIPNDVVEEIVDELWEETVESPIREFEEYVFQSLVGSTDHRGKFDRSLADIRTLLKIQISERPQQCLLRILY